MAFVPKQFPVKRVQEPAPVTNLLEIQSLNWHRMPPKIAPSTPVNVPTVSYTGGVANQGATAGNGGEVGTINSTSASRGQAWNTQAEKAATIGTTQAVDVGHSYHGTRGVIEPHERYPSTNGAEVPAAFRRSDYIVPGTP